LLHANAAYIKERLSSRVRQGEGAFPETAAFNAATIAQ